MSENYGDTLAQKIAKRIGPPTASTTTLSAIGLSSRVDGMLIAELTGDTLWQYSASSSAGASTTVIVPDDAPATGRWLKQAIGSAMAAATLALTTNGNGASLVGLEDAAGALAAATVEAAIAELAARSNVRQARGVVTVDVPDLAAFVITQDGVTYAAGDRVLLANQTTAAQCGLYVVGAVSGTAPLTRATDMASGQAYVNGCVVEVSEGTIWKGSTWKSMATGAKVVGTHDPLFYPKVWHKKATLVAGTVTLASTDDVWLFSATTSTVHVTRNTANTTTLTTGGYTCPSATRTAGKKATGSIDVWAAVAAGTINTADISTLDVTIINF